MNAEYIIMSPQLTYAEAFANAYSDYFQANEQKYIDLYAPGVKDFPTYMKWLSDLEKGINLPDGWVPETTRWLINSEKQIAGFIRVRPRLTPPLEEEIGHIGYDVPPTERKKGYGRCCLKVASEIAKELGLQKALVTCDSDNLGSKRIIESAGAQLENEIIPKGQSYSVCRYWLEI